MKFERIQSGPFENLDTHTGKGYPIAFRHACINRTADWVIIDPFARTCPWGTIRNDLNEDMPTQYHMDALEFMKIMETSSADLILFDPPFSPIQAERYGEGMSNIYTNGPYISALMTEIDRVLKSGGLLLKLGYNTTRHRPTFVLEATWLVNVGGNRNDVIITQWRKAQMRLDDPLFMATPP